MCRFTSSFSHFFSFVCLFCHFQNWARHSRRQTRAVYNPSIDLEERREPTNRGTKETFDSSPLALWLNSYYSPFLVTRLPPPPSSKSRQKPPATTSKWLKRFNNICPRRIAHTRAFTAVLISHRTMSWFPSRSKDLREERICSTQCKCNNGKILFTVASSSPFFLVLR